MSANNIAVLGPTGMAVKNIEKKIGKLYAILYQDLFQEKI